RDGDDRVVFRAERLQPAEVRLGEVGGREHARAQLVAQLAHPEEERRVVDRSGPHEITARNANAGSSEFAIRIFDIASAPCSAESTPSSISFVRDASTTPGCRATTASVSAFAPGDSACSGADCASAVPAAAPTTIAVKNSLRSTCTSN